MTVWHDRPHPPFGGQASFLGPNTLPAQLPLRRPSPAPCTIASTNHGQRVCARAQVTSADTTLRSTTMKSRLITIDPEIHSGSPVFADTRVPVKTLFDHLEAADSLEVFLDDFPSVSKEAAVALLEEARLALLPDAHTA